MVNISTEEFRYLLCSMKMVVFLFKFYWHLFPWFQFTIRQYWCRSWLDNETGDKSLFEPMMALVTDGYVHYSDVIMSVMASQITCVLICSAVDQRKHQRSATLAFVRGIQRWPVDSPNKSPATRIMFSFDAVIMSLVVIYWRMCALVGPNDLKLGLMFSWCTDCQ